MVTEALDLAVGQLVPGAPCTTLPTGLTLSYTLGFCTACAQKAPKSLLCSSERHIEGSWRFPEKEQSLRGGSKG